MSYCDHHRLWRPIRAALAVLLAAVTAVGCQVRPLHVADGAARPNLAAQSISISSADTRVEQQVRNHLIFLSSGGQGEPSDPRYTLDLDAAAQSVGVLIDQSRDTATAGRMIVTGNYVLRGAPSANEPQGALVKAGSRRVTAAFDLPDQEFARLRSTRDAEDRAARELAELIYADIAAALAR